jgi:hypothetical protein
MPIGLIFWVLMLIWILSKFAVWRGIGGPYVLGVSEWLILVLFFLLGWHSFGFIVQG